MLLTLMTKSCSILSSAELGAKLSGGMCPPPPPHAPPTSCLCLIVFGPSEKLLITSIGKTKQVQRL